MTVFAAPINVKNAALTGIGAKPLQSETATTAEARVLASHYELIVQEALTKHAYHWAKKKALLVKKTETPEGLWTYALPPDCLNIRYITYRDNVVDVTETDEGEPILPENDELYIHYTWRVPEARWPADFADGIVKKLQAALKRGLLGDDNAAEGLDEIAELKLRRGMVRDKRQVRGRQVTTPGRMVQIWHGTRRHGPTS